MQASFFVYVRDNPWHYMIIMHNVEAKNALHEASATLSALNLCNAYPAMDYPAYVMVVIDVCSAKFYW